MVGDQKNGFFIRLPSSSMGSSSLLLSVVSPASPSALIGLFSALTSLLSHRAQRALQACPPVEAVARTRPRWCPTTRSQRGRAPPRTQQGCQSLGRAIEVHHTPRHYAHGWPHGHRPPSPCFNDDGVTLGLGVAESHHNCQMGGASS
jgi:hypothetical protein